MGEEKKTSSLDETLLEGVDDDALRSLLAQLDVKRRTEKGWLERAVMQAEAALQDTDLAQMMSAKDRLTKKMADIELIQSQILDNISPEEVMDEMDREAPCIEHAALFETRLMVRIRELSPTTSNPVSGQGPGAASMPRSRTGDHHSGFRLREIPLREFHGQNNEWSEFWDLFEVAVDKRPDLFTG